MGVGGSKGQVEPDGGKEEGSEAAAAPGGADTVAFHPDLVKSAGSLPTGIARWWNLYFLKGVFVLAYGLAGTKGKRVQLSGCSLFLHRPDGAGAEGEAGGKRPAMLYLHGGGLIFGDARQDDAFVRSVVKRLGITVASVQYRCAPQHPFPTPLDDAEEAFIWLAAQPSVDPERVVICGNSAGGNLAAALCQRLHARGAAVRPCFQVLTYPMLDNRSAEGSGPHDDKFRIWDRASNALGWGHYLQGCDWADPPPFSVPARADDTSGLPPAWIGVGDLDLFYPECDAYARRLRIAGVEADLVRVGGAYHGFETVDPEAGVSKAFSEQRLAAIAKGLGLPPPPPPPA